MITLMYHCVYEKDPGESGFQDEDAQHYKVSKKAFLEQLETLKSYCTRKGSSLSETISFSFDDGGSSFYHVIAPVLEQYGLKGLFFISTALIGTPGFMTREEVLELRKRGHIIGSHSHTHRHFYELNRQDTAEEWRQSIAILQELLQEKVEYASIPNGDISDRVVETASLQGIKYLYTSKPVVKESIRYEVCLRGRFVIHSNTSASQVLALVKSPAKRFLILMRRKLILSVKQMLGDNYNRLKSLIIR